MQNDLYQAILTRRSVRRYDNRLLGEPVLAQVREILAAVRPLIAENRFEVLLRDVSPGEDLVASLGAYGRIVSPPHYLVPYLTGEDHLLVDLGYRVEQIAVRLAALGIGTCYVGSLNREAEVRARFKLPEGARIGAFLAFGRPSQARGGRLVNTVLRRAVGASNKLPVERIFFRGTFDTPDRPSPEIAPLVEAGRNAPSAANTQPWRFLLRGSVYPLGAPGRRPRRRSPFLRNEGSERGEHFSGHGERLYLFVRCKNLRYGTGATADYRLYDGGICMANVAMALEALGREGQWQMLVSDEADLPAHPPDLQPLAMLVLQAP